SLLTSMLLSPHARSAAKYARVEFNARARVRAGKASKPPPGSQARTASGAVFLLSRGFLGRRELRRSPNGGRRGRGGNSGVRPAAGRRDSGLGSRAAAPGTGDCTVIAGHESADGLRQTDLALAGTRARSMGPSRPTNA